MLITHSNKFHDIPTSKGTYIGNIIQLQQILRFVVELTDIPRVWKIEMRSN